MPETLDDAELVKRVRGGEAEAFTILVQRYQNAIYGLAYHHLGDFEDARDAAQETFIRAYSCLHLLNEPDKFSAWLRQIAINQCRMRRRKCKSSEQFEAALPVADAAAQVDTQVAVQQALACLSEATRLTVTLFYMQSMSLREIAAFFDVPITTVKSRLRDARARLKKEMAEMVEDTMKQEVLPIDFAGQVQRLIAAGEAGDTSEVKELLDGDAHLVNAQGPGFFWYGESPALHLAVKEGHREVVELLLNEGADVAAKSRYGFTPLYIAAGLESREIMDLLLSRGARQDIFTALKLDDVVTVKCLLEDRPHLVQARGPWGATPLHVARTVEVAQLLLEYGAAIDILDDFFQSTPVDYQCYNVEVREFLISKGATVDIFLASYLNDIERISALIETNSTLLDRPAYKHHRPGQGATPLGNAAQKNHVAAAVLLLDRGAEVNAAGEGGFTPLHWAAMYGQRDVAALLLARGADTTLKTNGAAPRWDGKTPLECALEAAGKGLSFEPGAPDYDEVIELLQQ